MAPLPKRKHSTQRKGKRTHALKTNFHPLVVCKNCGKKKKPHRICKYCNK